jgi:EAL domain-containing protein (putative c-di-GMP-specific phosphodiesterase class I)
VLIDPSATLDHALRTAQDLGVKLCMDDFGRGYREGRAA